MPVDNEFARAWQRSYPTGRKVEIRQSDRIAAPLAYGIVRPVILLPKGMDWTHEKHLEYVLVHELVHIRRFDPLLKLLLVVAVCVHWFNPLVWGMYVLANRDIELSCDEAVVRTFGESIKSAYALTLIGLEEKRSSAMPLVNNFSKNSIEERIVAIMKMKKASVIGVVAAVLIVAGATVAFATEAKNSTGSYNPTKPLEASTTPDSAAGRVQPNQVESQGWKLTVTKTVIGKLANDPTKKVAGVYISLTNNSGPDKAFSPKGKIVGVIGGSGKFYKIDWLNSLDTMNSKGQRTMKMAAKEEAKPYYPGVFKFAAQLYIDAGEQNLAQLVYEDDNGTKLDIPIQGAPEVPKSTPGGR